MILQYKGFKNNWVYEEAESIAISTVEITKTRIDIGEKDSLHQMESVRKTIEKEISDATQCSDFVYIIDKPIFELGYVKVAILAEQNKHLAYVFDVNKEAYLLNNNGGTVRRI